MTTRLLAATAALSLLFAGCSGANNDDGRAPSNQDEPILRLFDPAGGDAVARATLPEPADLPGTGWEVTARDEFDDDTEDDELFQDLPSCQHLNDLAFSAPGWMDGPGDDSPPAGRAQIELSRTVQGAILPTSVEVEVEIAETVAEMQAGWPIARTILTSEETKRCFEDMFSLAFAQEESTGQFTVEMSALEPLGSAPHDGVSLAFAMKMSMNRVELLDARMEMYMWPYSNAGITVLFFSESKGLTSDLVGDALSAVDGKVVAAGTAQ